MSTHIGLDRELENKHRTLWGLGDYGAIAAELVAPLGPELVGAAGVGPGIRVLDVAAGTGNAAIAAARTGAEVVATDLVPELLARGQRCASAAGVGLVWQEANAEALPFDDATFDTVLSCIGVMFAPHHRQAADELARVCRPGGTVGVTSWTPEGFIGKMFATMKPFVPPPPPGASPPPLWGSEEYVATLFAGKLGGLESRRRCLAVDRFPDGASFRDYFKANYGPTIAAYRGVAAEPQRVAELDAALADLGDRALAGATTMDWEYLVVTAHVAG
jgi:SAM-dependent methyltransferase